MWRGARGLTPRVALVLLLGLGIARPARVAAQTRNILLPVDSAEYLLGRARFNLPEIFEDTRFAGDRTQRVPLWFADSTSVLVKWATAPRGGEAFNNNPRYELAAYAIQKLFLDGDDYVVPPTMARMLPWSWLQQLDPKARPTFDEGGPVLVVLQYFLVSVTGKDVFDERRIERDPVYARRWANVNLLTYLIAHNDSNQGNLVISEDATDPRIFAVDNGLAFNSEGNRGTRWRELQVDRFPAEALARLRRVTEAELEQKLGVLVQFEPRGDEWVPTEPGANLDRDAGVRHKRGIIQLGLTRTEIRDLWRRLTKLLEDVDRGRLRALPASAGRGI